MRAIRVVALVAGLRVLAVNLLGRFLLNSDNNIRCDTRPNPKPPANHNANANPMSNIWFEHSCQLVLNWMAA